MYSDARVCISRCAHEVLNVLIYMEYLVVHRPYCVKYMGYMVQYRRFLYSAVFTALFSAYKAIQLYILIRSSRETYVFGTELKNMPYYSRERWIFLRES